MNFDSIQPVRDYEINFFFSFNSSEFYRLHVEVEDQTIVIKTIVVKKFDSSSMILFSFFFLFLFKQNSKATKRSEIPESSQYYLS